MRLVILNKISTRRRCGAAGVGNFSTGFTLLELLITISILAILSLAIFGVLEDIGTSSIREASRSEVQRELRFSLETISQKVRESSYIETATSSVLSLRMRDTAKDPTTISLSSGVLNVQEGSSTLQAITGNKINVDSAEFVRVQTPGAKDAVEITLSFSYQAGNNPQAAFSQTLSNLIARANAAVFDSDILPGSDNLYSVGLGPTPRWLDATFSRNVVIGNNLTVDSNTFYVDATNNRVGIGTTNPSSLLHVEKSVGGDSVDITVKNTNAGLNSQAGIRLINTAQNVNANWFLVTGSTLADNSSLFFHNVALGVPRMTIEALGNVGIGTASPQSLLEVASGGYLQFSKTSAGAPTATDCDADAERGRLVIDTTNNRLYVCGGAARGWDFVNLTD